MKINLVVDKRKNSVFLRFFHHFFCVRRLLRVCINKSIDYLAANKILNKSDEHELSTLTKNHTTIFAFFVKCCSDGHFLNSYKTKPLFKFIHKIRQIKS